MFKKFSFLVVAIILSGCTKYVVYEVPYCIEATKIPRPYSISIEQQIELTDIPCDSIECNEFVRDYQLNEIKQLEKISNYVGESQLRFAQYERRVDLCIETNQKTKDLIAGKIKEVGSEHVEVVPIKVVLEE